MQKYILVLHWILPHLFLPSPGEKEKLYECVSLVMFLTNYYT